MITRVFFFFFASPRLNNLLLDLIIIVITSDWFDSTGMNETVMMFDKLRCGCRRGYILNEKTDNFSKIFNQSSVIHPTGDS